VRLCVPIIFLLKKTPHAFILADDVQGFRSFEVLPVKILAFPTHRCKQLRVSICAGCRSHFRPRAQHHKLCRSCFFWNRGLQYLEAASVSMHRASGGR
jgi:hypothetical protein